MQRNAADRSSPRPSDSAAGAITVSTSGSWIMASRPSESGSGYEFTDPITYRSGRSTGARFRSNVSRSHSPFIVNHTYHAALDSHKPLILAKRSVLYTWGIMKLGLLALLFLTRHGAAKGLVIPNFSQGLQGAKLEKKDAAAINSSSTSRQS